VLCLLTGECCLKITLLWRVAWTVLMLDRGTHGIAPLILFLAMGSRCVASQASRFYSVSIHLHRLSGVIFVCVCMSLIYPTPKIRLLWTPKIHYELASEPYPELMESSAHPCSVSSPHMVSLLQVLDSLLCYT